VEIINTIFRIGVILAIFGFLWALVQFAFTLLTQGFGRKIWQFYILKTFQYVFLVQVTILFCYENESSLSLSNNSIFISALILIFYFISKLQNRQKQTSMISMIQGGRNMLSRIFELKYEIALVIFGSLFFALNVAYPDLAYNKVSNWFYTSIVDLEDTPIFGFIFKFIGFFFLISVFSKLLNAVLFTLSPRKAQNSPQHPDDNRSDDDFDDFEEIQ